MTGSCGWFKSKNSTMKSQIKAKKSRNSLTCKHFGKALFTQTSLKLSQLKLEKAHVVIKTFGRV